MEKETLNLKPTAADLETFSKNMEYLMVKKGLDQEKFAEALQIHPARVKPWLQAQCFPQHKMMIRICQFFNFYDIYTLLTKSIKPQ